MRRGALKRCKARRRRDLRSWADSDLKKRTVSRSDRIGSPMLFVPCGNVGCAESVRFSPVRPPPVTVTASRGSISSRAFSVDRAESAGAPPLPPRSANCYKWKTTAPKKGSARAGKSVLSRRATRRDAMRRDATGRRERGWKGRER